MNSDDYRKLLIVVRKHVAAIERLLDAENELEGRRQINVELAKLTLAALAFVGPRVAIVESHIAGQLGDEGLSRRLDAVLAAHKAIDPEYLKAIRNEVSS